MSTLVFSRLGIHAMRVLMADSQEYNWRSKTQQFSLAKGFIIRECSVAQTVRTVLGGTITFRGSGRGALRPESVGDLRAFPGCCLAGTTTTYSTAVITVKTPLQVRVYEC